MAKLNDIKGYWDMSYSYDFNDRDMWEGQILLEDDGWFEGIVVDPNSSYKEDRFVFGIYHPGKVIYLFKLTPINISSPFKFHGDRDAKGYDGVFTTIGMFGENPCGVTHIITQDAEITRGEVDEEVKVIEAKIERWKNSIMDDVCKEFYQNSLAIRKSFCEIILRNHDGKGFTDAEIAEIMSECQPVNNRVIEGTAEAAMKLVRELPDDFFEDDDEDLPF